MSHFVSIIKLLFRAGPLGVSFLETLHMEGFLLGSGSINQSPKMKNRAPNYQSIFGHDSANVMLAQCRLHLLPFPSFAHNLPIYRSWHGMMEGKVSQDPWFERLTFDGRLFHFHFPSLKLGSTQTHEKKVIRCWCLCFNHHFSSPRHINFLSCVFFSLRPHLAWCFVITEENEEICETRCVSFDFHRSLFPDCFKRFILGHLNNEK